LKYGLYSPEYVMVYLWSMVCFLQNV
jgi:hypothetical protein